MKFRILAIAIVFFFGIATNIMIRKASENTRIDKGTVNKVTHSNFKKKTGIVLAGKNKISKKETLHGNKSNQ